MLSVMNICRKLCNPYNFFVQIELFFLNYVILQTIFGNILGLQNCNSLLSPFVIQQGLRIIFYLKIHTF